MKELNNVKRALWTLSIALLIPFSACKDGNKPDPQKETPGAEKEKETKTTYLIESISTENEAEGKVVYKFFYDEKDRLHRVSTHPANGKEGEGEVLYSYSYSSQGVLIERHDMVENINASLGKNGLIEKITLLPKTPDSGEETTVQVTHDKGGRVKTFKAGDITQTMEWSSAPYNLLKSSTSMPEVSDTYTYTIIANNIYPSPLILIMSHTEIDGLLFLEDLLGMRNDNLPQQHHRKIVEETRDGETETVENHTDFRYILDDKGCPTSIIAERDNEKSTRELGKIYTITYRKSPRQSQK